MASTSVSEDQRTTRNEMAYASVEIAKNLRAVAERMVAVTWAPEVATRAERLAELFDRLELQANGDRAISDANLRSTGRVFEDVAIAVNEACQFVGLAVVSPVAVEHVAARLWRVGELVGQALVICDVRLA